MLNWNEIKFNVIKRPYYAFRLFKRIWKSYLAPWDMVESLLEINMEMFCEFYEKGQLDRIDWTSDIEHQRAKNQMDEIHTWWTVERPKRQEEIEELLDTWNEHFVFYSEPCKDHPGWYEGQCLSTRYSEYLNKMYHELEEHLWKKEGEYLVMLIGLRKWLWT
jgi:hypothetical protein